MPNFTAFLYFVPNILPRIVGLDMNINIVNVKSVSVEAQFMKRLNNIEAEFKKSVAYKKSV